MTFTRCDGKEVEIDGCMGCEIVNKKVDSFGGTIYEDDNFFVVQDFELPVNGFIVISTKRCVESINDLSKDERVELIGLINRVLQVLKEVGVCQHFNIVQQEKEGYHFHVWLMPTHPWMREKFGKVLKNLSGIFDYAKQNFRDEKHLNEIAETCEKLREKLK